MNFYLSGMDFSISYSNPNHHIIDFSLRLNNVHGEKLNLHLPAWRPGRYTIQNFAKNILSLKAYGEDNLELSCKKITKDQWCVDSGTNSSIEIRYNYYAFQMDAGNTWLDDEQLYLNFINCLVYAEERLNNECQVSIEVPSNYGFATGLTKIGNQKFKADSFYHLVDSPMFASKGLRKISYKVSSYIFNIWIQGELPRTDQEIVHDFKRFTETQIDLMGEFPCPEYHFLFQCLPYTHYHGVEHWNSTVITIGPSHELNNRPRYKDLLGVSSHELFHTWNVIRLRPKEMMPYDFQKENYHQTGFITEGVTTYYGDLLLVRSGVISLEEYLGTLNKLLKKHYDNEGRKGYSLAASSFDLWLDGYEKGIPGRKVSIYNEGALAALILDLMIRDKFNNGKSLDDVMRLMWVSHGRDFSGYSYEDYQRAAESVFEASLSDYFSKIISGNEPFESYLSILLPKFRLSFKPELSDKIEEHNFGFRLNENIITDISNGSPADESLSIGDKITSINDIPFELGLLQASSLKLQVNRFGRLLDIDIIAKPIDYFSTYSVSKNTTDSTKTCQLMSGWLLPSNS